MRGKATILHAPSLHEQDEDDGYLGINHPNEEGKPRRRIEIQHSSLGQISRFLPQKHIVFSSLPPISIQN